MELRLSAAVVEARAAVSAVVAVVAAAADIVCRPNDVHCNRLIGNGPPGSLCPTLSDEASRLMFDKACWAAADQLQFAWIVIFEARCWGDRMHEHVCSGVTANWEAYRCCQDVE